LVNYELIKQEYNIRKKKYSHLNISSVVSKAYSRFKRGVEIRWEDILNYSRRKGQNPILNELLIELPQIKMVKNKVYELISNVETSNEMGIQVIYGEYGQGKSQIAQILAEQYHNKSLYSTIIYIYHKISTISNFVSHICNIIRKEFEGSHGLGKVEIFLDKLEYSMMQMKSFPEVINYLIKTIQEVSRQGRTILLVIDELDIILTNPEEFKPWGDLFVRLNDSEDLNLILLLLLPQATAEKIKNFDSRFERWDIAFGINAVILTGKYLKLLPQAITNILSMKSITSKINFNNFFLEFASSSIDFMYKNMKKSSIRTVNLWAVELSEMFHELMDLNWEKRYHNFLQEDTYQQGNILEKNLRAFLAHCQLPDFQLKNPDTDDFDVYQSNFYNENLKFEDKESDGHILITKILNEIPIEEAKIAIEIKYTSTGDHTSDQIMKIKTLARGFPLIFFSLGSSDIFFESLLKKIESWYSESIIFYPILPIRLPKTLLSPLLILQEKSEPEFLKAINIIRVWARRFCPFLQSLEDYFKNLPEKLIDRQIKIRLMHIIDKEKVTGGLEPFIEGKKIPKIKNGINLLCTFIEDAIKSHKQLHVLERDIRKKIKDLYPTIENEFMSLLPQLLSELVHNNLLETFKWGGTKDAIKKHKLNWNLDKAIKILSSKFAN